MHRALLAPLLLLLTACSGLTEHSSEGGDRVIPRPDGVLVVYQKAWERNRFRMPMDHGPATETTAAVYQAFLYPADGGAPRPVPLDLAVDYDNLSPDQRFDLPLLTWRDGRILPSACRDGADMDLDCSGIAAASIFQLRGRIEDVSLQGRRLMLARGPDGATDCLVDLSAISTSPPVAAYPVDASQWTLAHFPGSGTYLVDKSSPALPLYRLQCGQPPERLADLAVPGTEWTEVIDIAPGPDASNPLVLFSTRDRFQQVILRDMQREIVALDTDANDRNRAYFLDASGARIVLADDGIFRETPGLKLTLFTVATGERRKLTWSHAWARWPDKP